MSTVLVIAGLIVMLAGGFLLIRPTPAPPAPSGKPEALPDIGKWLEQLKDLMNVFDQHMRTGLFVMILGFVLVLLGIWLDVRDTNDAVTTASLLLN